MIGQRISQARKMVGTQTGSQRTVLMQVMFFLALCVLIGGMTPTAAAWHANDSMPSQRLYARQAAGIWFSDDAGLTWSQAGALPSRPLAMAVAERTSSPGTPGLVFVGTESDGLLRSNDGGASWQPVESAVLSGGYVAPLAVTALAIDPEDEQIIYAATNIWLGTNAAHLTPLGVAVSVDGGRQWLQLSRAALSDAPVWHLESVAGQPLSVMTVNSIGSFTVSLKMGPELLGLLQDGNPAVRASAARAIGLIGDAAALPGLLQALADTDTLAGLRIAEAIGRIGDRTIGDRTIGADLLNLLASGPAVERTRAALALGMLKSREAVPGLAALLSTGDPEAQRVAAEALAAIGTPAAMAALTAPLADQQVTSARHAAMGGLEMAGQPAVVALVAALNDSSAVVRINSAGMLGWLKPADAVADLARLLADSDPAVQAEAAWALGEIDTEPARLALNPAPILAPVAGPVAPAPLAALPALIAEVVIPAVVIPAVAIPDGLANTWNLAALAALLVLALLAFVLTWKGPRPTSHLGHT